MRNLPAALSDRIGAGSTSLTRVWTITRADLAVRRFTSLDRDIEVAGNLYRASSAFTISDITASKARGAQSVEMRVQTADDGFSIGFDDLVRGLYDNASVVVEIVDFEEPGAGTIVLFDGFVGDIEAGTKGSATVELVGRLKRAQQNLLEVFTPECRADLYDGRCRVDQALFAGAGQVTSVVGARSFNVGLAGSFEDHYFSFGTITWTTGDNAGSSVEVLQQAALDATQDTIVLALATPRPVQANDGFDIFAGCDKSPNTCINKFANIVNFRGEPFVPGPDILKSAPPAPGPPLDPAGNIVGREERPRVTTSGITAVGAPGGGGS